MSEVEQMRSERNMLADAIRNAAVKAGIVRPEVSLTGPMLLMICDNLADMAGRKVE